MGGNCCSPKLSHGTGPSGTDCSDMAVQCSRCKAAHVRWICDEEWFCCCYLLFTWINQWSMLCNKDKLYSKQGFYSMSQDTTKLQFKLKKHSKTTGQKWHLWWMKEGIWVSKWISLTFLSFWKFFAGTINNSEVPCKPLFSTKFHVSAKLRGVFQMTKTVNYVSTGWSLLRDSGWRYSVSGQRSWWVHFLLWSCQSW